MNHQQQNRSDRCESTTARTARAVLVAWDGDGSSGGLVRLPAQGGRLLPDVSVAGLACVGHPPFLPVAYTPTGPGAALQAWSTGGALSLLATRSAKGTEPCHRSVHPSGRALVVVSYGSRTLLVPALDDSGVSSQSGRRVVLKGSDLVAGRQDTAHPHQAVFVGERHLLVVPDLGPDLPRTFALDVVGASLTGIGTSVLPPGTSSRHLVRTRNAGVVVTGELSGDAVPQGIVRGRRGADRDGAVRPRPGPAPVLRRRREPAPAHRARAAVLPQSSRCPRHRTPR